MMQPEFVICVDGLPEELREKFLTGFLRSFYASKLDFDPPYEFDVRMMTPEERLLIQDKKRKRNG